MCLSIVISVSNQYKDYEYDILHFFVLSRQNWYLRLDEAHFNCPVVTRGKWLLFGGLDSHL